MREQINKKGKIFGSLIRLLLSICIVSMLGIVIVRKCFYITSEQAFINTKLVTLRSPITGIIQFSEVTIGASVEEKQVLFKVSNPRFGNTESNTQYNNLQNLIDTVDNEIAQDMLHIQKYEVDYQRFERLKKVGGVAERDFEEIANSLSVLKAAVENKKKQRAHLQQCFEEMKHQLELQKDSVVIAPCRGVVWAVLTKDGEHVNVGDEIMQIVNPQDVWVDAFFSEGFAARLSPDMRVIVRAIGSKNIWDGEIAFIRGGSGRVMYNAAIEIPPTVLSRRLVAVRVKVDWRGEFKASEFYGIGRSMTVSRHR